MASIRRTCCCGAASSTSNPALLACCLARTSAATPLESMNARSVKSTNNLVPSGRDRREQGRDQRGVNYIEFSAQRYDNLAVLRARTQFHASDQ